MRHLLYSILYDVYTHPIFYITIYFFIVYLCYFVYIYYVPPLPVTLVPYLCDIYNEFDTFDLLYFTCHEFTSNIGKFIQHTPYPHVAMVVRIRDTLYVWEADNHKDSSRPGVDIMRLEDCLSTYPSVYFALQKIILPTQLRVHAKRRLISLIKKHQGKDFKCKLYIFLLTILKLGRNIDMTTDTGFFCSELIACTYKYCGLMNDVYPDWWHTPGDFYHHKISFRSVVKYGDFIPFKYDPYYLNFCK
jgi:hypothetical protein